MTKLKTFFWLLIFFLSILSAIVLFYCRVDDTVTEEDRIYISKYFEDAGIQIGETPQTYDQELALILDVQRAVLLRICDIREFPLDHPREPKDVYIARIGMCTEGSRVIEKILNSLGFKTRHLYIFSINQEWGAIGQFIKGKESSHAVVEVLTRKGWVVVEPLVRWISVDSNNNPVSIVAIQKDIKTHEIVWNSKYLYNMNSIFKKPFGVIYGVYSMNGRAYPPYNFIPDINYQQFMKNFW